MSVAVAILRRGATWRRGVSLRDQPTAAEHRSFVRSLLRDGVVTDAGPLTELDSEPDDLVGLIVFANADLAAASSTMAEDPGVLSGAIAVEVVPWHR